MAHRTLSLRVGLAAFGAACVRHATLPAPVACPPEPPPPLESQKLCLDCHGWPSIGFPLTLVVDGGIAAITRDTSDSVSFNRAWAKLEPSTIKKLDLVREPRARELYPGSVGDVLSVTRCY